MKTYNLVLIAAGMPEFELVKLLEKSLIDCKRSRKIEDLAPACMMILHKCAINEAGLEAVLKQLKKSR